MNECLTIKLKESSTANNLTRLGALKFNVGLVDSRTVVLQLYSHTEQTIRVNRGYFTGTTSQEYNAPAGWINTSIEASSGITEIEFSNKFGISRLNSMNGTNPMWAVGTNNFEIFVDFEDFRYCTSLESIFLSLGNGGGDLDNFKKVPMKNIIISPDGTNMFIEGDISGILSQTNLENIVLTNQSQVTGNLSSFVGKTITADIFELSGTSVTGSINALSGVRTNYLILKRMRKFIGGDIASLHNGVKFFSVADSQNNVFTFSSFNSRTNFLAIEGAFLKSGVNDLITQSANLSVFPTSTAPLYERTINVWGAYDYKKADVQDKLNTLKNKNIEVRINGILENP